jgi:Site-specific recombinases, DNA invertase Pin homologs
MKSTCCIIVRVSTVKQETLRQVSELTQVADKNGWEIVSVLEETISGNIPLENRPSLMQAMQMAMDGRIGRVLVHEVSRLGRRSSLVHTFVETLEAHGVSLYWHAQRIETLLPDGRRNPSAAIMLALLAEMARAERETLIERINSGLRNARDKGVKLGRPAGSGVAPQVRHAQAAEEIRAGEPASVVAARHGISTRTVWRIKASMARG